MFCNKCGKEVLASASFCHNCGEQIDISSQSKKKKAPDPSFGAKPIVHSSKKDEKPLAAVLPVQPKEPEKTTEEKIQEEKTAEKIDEVVKILKDEISEDEEEIIFSDIEPIEPPLPPKKKKSGKSIAVAVVFFLVAAIMIFAALIVMLPETKPFSNIREALGIAQTATDSPEISTTFPETTEKQTQAESLQPADGTALDKPVAPDIATAEKIRINAIAYSEGNSIRVEFAVDYTAEGETVFYIPADARAQTADMIYVLSENGTYNSYEGGYGHFFAVDTDKEYDIQSMDIPDNLVVPIALLNESYRSDYSGKYIAAGSEIFDGTGTAYVYGVTSENETETVWVDADTGVFVKRRNSDGDAFVVTAAQINSDVTIPDFRNNIIEE